MISDPQTILQAFKDIPAPIATVIISMLPVFELRGGLPLAITVYKMSVASAFFWSVLGNVLVAVLVILFLEKTSALLSLHFKFFKNFFDWLFERTHRRARDKINKYGSWGLFFLVAIPLPMTGGWTGALAAFLFGIPRRKSIPIIALGIIAAGIIVTITTLGVMSL